jgi:amino acid transporter
VHFDIGNTDLFILVTSAVVLCSVAGGPFGIEVAVQSAGALATVLGLFAAGVTWGLPQALITAELAAALPSNGGPVHWVTRAFGRRWGFINGLLLVFQQATDICMYPTLIASYVSGIVPMSKLSLYAVKAAALLLAVIFNVIGVDALSASAAVLTALIMLPFILLPIVAGATGSSFDWTALGPAGTPPNWSSSIALFVSTVLWNMQGWSEMGCVAGEVRSAEIVFPRGMAIAAVLVTLAYATPVLFGVALQVGGRFGVGVCVCFGPNQTPLPLFRLCSCRAA